jgi:hypothetical protein
MEKGSKYLDGTVNYIHRKSGYVVKEQKICKTYPTLARSVGIWMELE